MDKLASKLAQCQFMLIKLDSLDTGKKAYLVYVDLVVLNSSDRSIISVHVLC